MTAVLPPAPPAHRNGSGPEPARPDGPGDGSGLCRLTVLAPADGEIVRGRADLAVPVGTTPGELLAVLLRRMAAPGADATALPAQRWSLQRLGDEPFDPDRPLETLDLLDGEVLHLRPAADPVPPLRYDDVPDGIADAVGERPDRWNPTASRLLMQVIALISLAGGVLSGVAALPPVAQPWVGWGLAVLFTAGGLVLLHRGGPAARGPAVTAGWGGVALAVLTGLALPAGPTAILTPTYAGTVAALIGAFVTAAAMVAIGRAAVVGFGAVAAVAAATGVALALTDWAGLGLDGGVAVTGVVLFMIGSVGPRIAARVFGLRVPELPRTSPELQSDIDPIDGDVVAIRTARADKMLTALFACCAVSTIAVAVLLQDGEGWASWVLPVLLAAASALRAHPLQNIAQRYVLTIGATAAAGVMAAGMARDLALGWGIALLCLGVLGAVGALVAAWRMAGRRLLPIWGRLTEIGETLTAVAMVPILLQVLGVFGTIRGMNG